MERDLKEGKENKEMIKSYTHTHTHTHKQKLSFVLPSLSSVSFPYCFASFCSSLFTICHLTASSSPFSIIYEKVIL